MQGTLLLYLIRGKEFLPCEELLKYGTSTENKSIVHFVCYLKQLKCEIEMH